jgi:hypothetical protein
MHDHVDSVLAFAVTYDYRCPFARNVHEHVLLGLAAGAPWDVAFVPFSLSQVHVSRGEPDVWDDPARVHDLLAMRVGVAVRDRWPERFRATHGALFAARHDEGLDLRDDGVLAEVVSRQGLDARAVLEWAAGDEVRDTLRREHEAAVAEHDIFGVPTVVVDGRAVFVRLMERSGGDAQRARRTVERLLDIVRYWPDLNELKATRIPR